VFTGLIEDLGKVRSIVQTSRHFRLTVETGLPETELTLGESIAVNGICLTVVAFGAGFFSADVSPETLKRTSLADLKPGSRVNLERALRLSGRLGGHLVSGHVDTVATLSSRHQEGNAVQYAFTLDPDYHRYIAEKGSICIDGISLTVNDLTAEGFMVTIIPHTLAETTLQFAQPGARVNIETDLICKYLERLLSRGSTSPAKEPLSLDFLAKHGFM
jgi:riboflavin synthase